MATEDHDQRSVQQDGHRNSLGLGRQSLVHPSGQRGGGLDTHSRHQQIDPQIEVTISGYTYSNPPAVRLDASDTTGQNRYQDIRSPSIDSRGASSSPSVAQYNILDLQRPAPHEGTTESQMPGPKSNHEHGPRTAIPANQPFKQSAQSSSSRCHRNPSSLRSAQRVAAFSTPSPLAVEVPYQKPYLPSQIDARPSSQSMHVRDNARERRSSAALEIDDEVADGERSTGEEYNELNEERDLSRIKGVIRAEKASTARANVRRGLTRTNADGELEWRATEHSDGVLAVRHYDIRSKLIAKAEAERVALGVHIEHPDEPGPGVNNVTSFYRKHVAWGPDRKDRPEILYAWEEDREKNPRPIFPGYMIWKEHGKDYLVLDYHDNLIKNWDLPATIASNIPGYKMEAMRRENMSLTHKDFWSRMPGRINVGTAQFPKWKELGTPDHSVNGPMERFRYQAGLSSWTERTKTLVVKEGLKKLYGNVIQNNSVKAFGRDIFPEEVKEIKKGKEAVFPIDFVHRARGARKRRSNGAAKPSRSKDDTELEKALLKRAADDEGQVSEEEARRPRRSRKTDCQGSEEGSIAADGNDLLMLDKQPFIIDRTDGPRRNPLRPTRGARLSGIVLSINELSDESSMDKEYEDVSTQHYSARRTRRSAATRHSESIEVSSEYSAETEDEEIPDHKSAFQRIPREGRFDGKSKGPSCISSSNDPSQRNKKKENRRTEVLGNRGQSAHYVTYEDLSGTEPAHRTGVSDIPLEIGFLTPEISGASLEQNKSSSLQSHASEAMMNGPFSDNEYPVEKLTALQAHREREKDFDEDQDGLESLRTEQPVLPLPAAAREQRVGNVAPQVTSRWPTSPRLNPHRVGHPSRAHPAPHAPSSKIREQQLATESAEIPESPRMGPGSKPVDYSTMPPSNNEEVRSLIDALFPTREIFYIWTGQAAPRTDPQQSYRAQFEIIHSAFQDWWGTHRANEPLPILTGAMHWGRSIDDWEPPVKDSIYYEAFRLANVVRRDDEGQSMNLLEWTGDSLELAVREMSCGHDRFGQRKA